MKRTLILLSVLFLFTCRSHPTSNSCYPDRKIPSKDYDKKYERYYKKNTKQELKYQKELHEDSLSNKEKIKINPKFR